jgi:hypothetical protein
MVGNAPEYEYLTARTPNVFVLGTVASVGISKFKLKLIAVPAVGALTLALTKFVVPFSLFATAPPATTLGFHVPTGAASVVATAARYGIFPFTAVPTNCSLIVVENVESSHDSMVGGADRAWLKVTLNTFRAELLFPAPATCDGIGILLSLPFLL